MRAYFLTNMYLSPIQKGIQTAHATAELFLKYHDSKETEKNILMEWARDHKTMIVLDGGNHKSLEKINHLLSGYGPEVHLPVACFREDEQSLNGAMTAVAVVLPERMYEAMSLMRQSHDITKVQFDLMYQGYDHVEIMLITVLSEFSLAR